TLFGSRSGTGDGKLDGVNPNSLFQDASGRIWVSTERGFGYLDDDRFISVSHIPGVVTSVAQDTAGSLWIADELAALFQVVGGHVVRQIPWTTLGDKGPASALAADPLRGGVWIGFILGGLSYFTENQVRASYGSADGLGEGRVRQLRFD